MGPSRMLPLLLCACAPSQPPRAIEPISATAIVHNGTIEWTWQAPSIRVVSLHGEERPLPQHDLQRSIARASLQPELPAQTVHIRVREAGYAYRRFYRCSQDQEGTYGYQARFLFEGINANGTAFSHASTGNFCESNMSADALTVCLDQSVEHAIRNFLHAWRRQQPVPTT